MFHFLELEQLSKIDGWSTDILPVLFHPIIISFVGTTVFAILGAQALRRQIKRIKIEGAGSVSVEWNIVFLAMFASLMPYGFERDSLALIVQCLLRTPFYVAIIRQLYRFHGNFTSFQWALIALMTVAAGLSLVYPTAIATALLWVSVVTAAHQPWKIWRTKSVEGVELRVLVVYLASAVFWTMYGFATTDYFIVSWAVGYLVVYTSGVAAHRVYSKEKMLDTAQVMNKLESMFKPVTGWRHFEKATGIVSLLNPLALVPQLYGVIVSDNLEAISLGMWCIFVIIQITFTLVAVKGKNLGMFISMAASVLISLSVITIVWLKM